MKDDNKTKMVDLKDLQLHHIQKICVDPTQEVIVTLDGKPLAAVISHKEYEQLQYFETLLHEIADELLGKQR